MAKLCLKQVLEKVKAYFEANEKMKTENFHHKYSQH